MLYKISLMHPIIKFILLTIKTPKLHIIYYILYVDYILFDMYASYRRVLWTCYAKIL